MTSKAIRKPGKDTAATVCVNVRVFRPIFVLLLFTIYGLLPSVTPAQSDVPAPPPIKLVTKAEKEKLAAKDNKIKDRTKLTLELMEVRLATAEKYADAKNFDSMFYELGVFHGLMDDGLDFLNAHNTGKGKVLDNFKRLEIGLRGFSPRIEVIRRDLPLQYDDYVLKLAKYVRDARTEATDVQFGNSVLPTRKSGSNFL